MSGAVTATMIVKSMRSASPATEDVIQVSAQCAMQISEAAAPMTVEMVYALQSRMNSRNGENLRRKLPPDAPSSRSNRNLKIVG